MGVLGLDRAAVVSLVDRGSWPPSPIERGTPCLPMARRQEPEARELGDQLPEHVLGIHAPEKNRPSDPLGC